MWIEINLCGTIIVSVLSFVFLHGAHSFSWLIIVIQTLYENYKECLCMHAHVVAIFWFTLKQFILYQTKEWDEKTNISYNEIVFDFVQIAVHWWWLSVETKIEKSKWITPVLYLYGTGDIWYQSIFEYPVPVK